MLKLGQLSLAHCRMSVLAEIGISDLVIPESDQLLSIAVIHARASPSEPQDARNGPSALRQCFPKDFDNLAETLATFVTVASMQLALRRLARASGVY
jgi:hypothetical protein